MLTFRLLMTPNFQLESSERGFCFSRIVVIYCREQYLDRYKRLGMKGNLDGYIFNNPYLRLVISLILFKRI